LDIFEIIDLFVRDIIMFVKAGNIPNIGVKAYNLYRCRLLDVNVPDFVVIPTEYYRKFRSCKLGNEKKIYSKLKKLFMKFDSKLVVRSSCVLEDGDKSSNAGMYKTVLDVDTYQKLIKAVKVVWHSSNGSDMAVIIQKQISPYISGVLFTRNPVTGKNETVIEYIEGFGSNLVSGKENPNKIIVKNDFNNKTGNKPRWKHNSMKDLIKISRTLESKFGYPLDIEWTSSNGKFYILQARPITYLPIPDHKAEITYSRVTAEQFYSGPVSPLFYSIFNHMYSNFYIKATIEALSMDINCNKILIRHKNHLYVNTSFTQALFHNLPIKNKEFLKVFPEDIKAELFNKQSRVNPRFIIKILKILIRNPKLLPSNLDKYFSSTIAPSVVQDLEIISNYNNMKKAELLFEITRLFKIANRHIQTSKWGLGLYLVPLLSGLDRLLKRNGMGSNLFHVLISGLEINKTIDASSELKKLSQIIKKSDQANEVFKTDINDYQNLKSDLVKVKNGDIIIDYFEFILRKYGHRRLSRDILEPSWSDEPMIPLVILKEMVLNGSPYAYNKPEIMKENTTEIISKINNQFMMKDRILLRVLLGYLKRYIAFRELQRFYLDMIISKMRELVLEISKRMKLESLLENKDDVFFLELSDITDFLIGKQNQNLQKKVNFNKITFKNENSVPGKYLRSGIDFDSLRSKKETEALPLEPGVNKLHGQPVSPGSFKGRVRVIKFFNENTKLAKNEILVTRSIDPGQTHAFLLAGALILEVGGILSHGAILAREFNMPAIAGIKNATKLFKDGQEIIVDGSRGYIIISPERTG
jgi:pyruvate,water dikinase